MSAAGRNVMKFVAGSAVGAGIGAAISTVMSRSDAADAEEDASALPLVDDVDDESSASPIARIRSAPQNLKQRWQRAKAAGEAAQIAEEVRLRVLFREKVNDSAALTDTEHIETS